MRPRILVVGCGAMGGTLAGGLASAHARTHQVEILVRDTALADRVREDGLRLTGIGGQRSVPVSVANAPRDHYEWVMLATRPPEVEEAARASVLHLAPEGRFVCIQNGLMEERVETIAGPRVLGAVITWGASTRAPGIFERTSQGGFTIGCIGERDDPRTYRLAALLTPLGPVDVAADLAGARWSKLILNCAISTLGTLGGDRMGALLRHGFVRELALRIMAEATDVARAEEVALARLRDGVDLEWLVAPDHRRAAHAVMLGVGLRYRRLRSSMLRAIERGRAPSIEFLNGEIVRRGEQRGIPTRANEAATAMVLEVAEGSRTPSVATLRALASCI